MPAHVLVCGVSARAMAESAAHAGFRVLAIDAFGDLDLMRAAPEARALRDEGVRWSAAACARLARRLDADAAAYGAPFENHPRAVHALAAGRALWGNEGALATARDPVVVAAELRARGCTAAESRRESPAEGDGRRWLLKRTASGGGTGIAPWRGGVPGRGRHLQERVEGTPGSVTFVARGGRIAPLAVTRQLVGDARFGASGMRYCGNVLAPPHAAQFARGDVLHERAWALARAAAEAFALVGVNGVDFVARDGEPWAIEINPRWTAAVELAERSRGVCAFALHALACEGELPHDAPPPVARDAVGKAVLFAREDIIVGDSRAWLADPDVRDIPRPGERIARGSPVCTIFARAADAASCEAALAARAEALYAELSPSRRRTA